MFGAIQSVAAAVLEAVEPALSEDLRAALHDIADGEAGPDGGGQAVDVDHLAQSIGERFTTIEARLDKTESEAHFAADEVTNLRNERDTVRAERAELRADVATLRARVAELENAAANTSTSKTRASGGK